VLVPDAAACCQVVTVVMPAPVSEIPVMVVAEPGLLREIVILEVAVADAEAVTPPYNVADESVTVFTLEPKRPNV